MRNVSYYYIVEYLENKCEIRLEFNFRDNFTPYYYLLYIIIVCMVIKHIIYSYTSIRFSSSEHLFIYIYCLFMIFIIIICLLSSVISSLFFIIILFFILNKTNPMVKMLEEIYPDIFQIRVNSTAKLRTREPQVFE